MLLKRGIKIFSPYHKSMFTILERKTKLEKKARFFLLDTKKNKNERYISGLYFVSKNENSGIITEVYYWDYLDEKFTLYYNSDGSYKIEKIE